MRAAGKHPPTRPKQDPRIPGSRIPGSPVPTVCSPAALGDLALPVTGDTKMHRYHLLTEERILCSTARRRATIKSQETVRAGGPVEWLEPWQTEWVKRSDHYRKQYGGIAKQEAYHDCTVQQFCFWIDTPKKKKQRLGCQYSHNHSCCVTHTRPRDPPVWQRWGDKAKCGRDTTAQSSASTRRGILTLAMAYTMPEDVNHKRKTILDSIYRQDSQVSASGPGQGTNRSQGFMRQNQLGKM